MPLQKQQINFPFSRGLDTKTDPKQVKAGSLLLLQNGRYSTPEEIIKRNGFTSLASLSSGSAVTTFRDQLVALDGSSLYSYSPQKSAAETIGSALSCGLTTKSIYKSSTSATQCDWAHDSVSGLSCYVAATTAGAIITVQDSTSGTTIYQVTEKPGAVAAITARVVVFNSYFVIFINTGSYSTGLGSLYAYKIQISSPTSITSIGTLQANTYGSDCIVSSSKLVWSANVSGTSTKVGYIDTSFVAQAAITATGVYTTPFLANDGSNNIWVFGMIQGSVGSAANGPFKYEIYTNALGSHLLALTTLDNSIAPASYDPGVATVSISGTTGTFYYGLTEVPSVSNGFASSQPGGFIKTVTGTTTGTVGSITTVIRALILASRPFSFGGSTCLFATYQSQTQSSYFVITTSGTILTQFANGSAYFGMGASINFLPGANNFLSGGGDTQQLINGYPLALVSPVSLSAGTIQIPYLVIDQITTVGGLVESQAGINLATLSTGVNPVHVLGGNNILFSGALPRIYDGVTIAEQGFLKYPENLVEADTNTISVIGPGTASTVNFEWVATYEWLDAQGNLHRSAPSPVPVSATIGVGSTVTFTATTTSGFKRLTVVSSFTHLALGQTLNGTGIPSGTYITDLDPTNSIVYISQAATAGAGGVSITTKDTRSVFVQVPTLRTTAKSNVIISLWRTLSNGTTFYRTTSIANPTYNDPTVDSITIQDITPDPILVGNDQLYTTGGVIENICLPPITSCWNFKGRVMAIAAEDSLSTWYSQEIQTSLPLQFNDTFTQQVDEQSGGLTAGAQMDDKCILFKANAIYFFVGDGPSPSGSNNDFGVPQRIATDTGCINPRSVVLMPQGLMYQSNNGIYLLDRSLQVSYIGAPVEAYNSATVTSALLVPGTTEVRFTLSTGVVLMYDYYISGLKGAPQWSVFLNIAASDACIYNETYTYISTGGSLLQETAGIFTDNGSFVPLGVTLPWFSFAGLQGYQRAYKMLLYGAYKSPHTITATLAYDFNPAVVQTVAIAVAASVTPYQFRIFLTRQRCEAVQVTLTETQSPAYGEGLSLSGVAFEVGIKKGLNKMPAASSYG